MERKIRRPVITPSFGIPRYEPSMYDRTEGLGHMADVETAERKFRTAGIRRRVSQVSALSELDIDLTVTFRQRIDKQTVQEQFRALAADLCLKHPAICMNTDIFGGVPHIKNVRLTVGDVLAKLYVYGNIQKIVDIYSPHVTEEQVKDAIAYAQDFLEMACDTDESSQVDG